MKSTAISQLGLFDQISGYQMINGPTGVKPFLKWAGGKSQLLPILRKVIPRTFRKYFEPFLGGGALFFDLGASSAFLSDTNEELVNAYQVVKSSPSELVETLSKYQVTKNNYYKIRSLEPTNLGDIERAARFIYLNKTCFNGLHRVNKQGQFNTPFGHNKNVNLVNDTNLFNASRLLKSAEIRCIDYQKLLLAEATTGDFIYLDPPYLPIGKYSDFKRYTKIFFYEEDHRKLSVLFKALDERGCKVLLSNSYHPTIETLYKGFNIQMVQAARFINCKGRQRGNVNELIISNFTPERNI